jgi:hypothetical protein
MSHLIGSHVLYRGEICRVLGFKTGRMLISREIVDVESVDPDLCMSVPEPACIPETLADRLARVWVPTLGTHARERANNVACWASPDVPPHDTLADLQAAIRVANRPDCGGKLTEREIARAAALGLAEILA